MIRKVLIANRGEIAIRIRHTLREMGIGTVAVFPEADASSLHVRSADESRLITNYLDPKEIVAAALATGADAIHPGYGFLSENPTLSALCEESRVIFIGPRPETIREMGDKLESKRRMEQVGIPTVPSWERDPPTAEYPVLVKAVGGGGGKGMRLVQRPTELRDALESAAREAASAFGDDRVFIEKYISSPRHIEYQIFGDAHGNCVHLFERECSIQRRHQKIIEESPSPAVTSQLRQQMGEAAVAAARAVNYRGAGTVEFILDPNGRFYFLEMNTRLQVEHPVTEMITGMDLVREQVHVAAGLGLSFKQSELHQVGHALECRIYSEVPEENFRPSTGRIQIFRPPVGPGIRLDSGVEQGSDVTYHFDPLVAKLIAWAPHRSAAIDRMKRALESFVLLGVDNNIEFLRRIISAADFTSGKLSTDFIESHPELFSRPQNVPPEVLLAASLNPLPRAEARGLPVETNSPWSSGSWRNS